jgi:hypothetical protein
MVLDSMDERRLVRQILALYAKNLPIRAVAEALGVGRKKVHNVLLRHGASRSRVDGIRLAKNKQLIPSSELLSLVDGLLLGDGHLTPGRACGLRGESVLILKQTEAHLPWVEQVQKQLEALGVSSKITRRPAATAVRKDGVLIRSKPAVVLKTPAYVWLSEQRARWYRGRTRVLPKDVQVDETSVRAWFYGDGHNGARTMIFHTQNFTEREVARLAQLLKANFRWQALQRLDDHGKPIVRLCVGEDIDQLRNLLRKGVPSCFSHKVVHRGCRRRIKPKRLWRLLRR